MLTVHHLNNSRHAAGSVLAAMALAMLAQTGAMGAGADRLPDNFVYLRDMAPSIVQDMRYATPNNFTGKPVPGYNAAECVLKRGAAEALKRAQEKAKALGYSLKVYDCYRPVRAVRAFLAWASAPEDGLTKRYYPHLQKSQLVPAYIASQSGHSLGASVDLTLIKSGPPLAAGTAPATGDCSAPAADREPDSSLDMGTAFDCFDPKANTASRLASSEQRRARMLLKSILEPEGFVSYSGEWWHFTFSGSTHGHAYDFPIEPRPSH